MAPFVGNKLNQIRNLASTANRRATRKWFRYRTKLRGAKLKWVVIYGPPRTGTTLMMRIASTASRYVIGDWGMNVLAHIAPEYDYIRLDRKRLLTDISNNIIDNAYSGNGTQLDLVVKQAGLKKLPYLNMVKMWGEPTMKIFCFREPAGYISSAKKHFSGPNAHSLATLHQLYLDGFNEFQRIGGAIFEYGPGVTKSDYLSFLAPLEIREDLVPDIVYRGKGDPEGVLDQMWAAYHDFRKAHANDIHPRP